MTESLPEDIRRRRIFLTSPGERNEVFETHATHVCFSYMRFIYRYYQTLRADQLQTRRRPNNSLTTRLRAALVHTYIAKGVGDWVQYKAVVYEREVMLKVRLNDKVVGLIKLDKTQINIVLLYTVLKVMTYRL